MKAKRICGRSQFHLERIFIKIEFLQHQQQANGKPNTYPIPIVYKLENLLTIPSRQNIQLKSSLRLVVYRPLPSKQCRRREKKKKKRQKFMHNTKAAMAARKYRSGQMLLLTIGGEIRMLRWSTVANTYRTLRCFEIHCENCDQKIAQNKKKKSCENVDGREIKMILFVHRYNHVNDRTNTVTIQHQFYQVDPVTFDSLVAHNLNGNNGKEKIKTKMR